MVGENLQQSDETGKRVGSRRQRWVAALAERRLVIDYPWPEFRGGGQGLGALDKATPDRCWAEDLRSALSIWLYELCSSERLQVLADESAGLFQFLANLLDSVRAGDERHEDSKPDGI
jgi:hypothetical protein